jgi:site-specific recombinase XerD
MSKRSSRSGPARPDDLDVHLTVFLATLAKVGYVAGTQHDKERLIRRFLRWVRKAAIAVTEIDESCVDAFLACPSRRRRGHRTALQQFLEHLRLVEAVPPRGTKPTAADALVQRYVDHLRDRRGLSHHSIAVYAPFARAFVAEKDLPQNAVALDALAVRRHQLEHGRDRSFSSVRLLAASLRSFLRFCFLDGIVATDLSIAVTPVRRWRLADVPPFLTAAEVERVIATADRSTVRGCRDLAILLLLSRLGMRASEVIALELADIPWKTGEIVVRGKGRLVDRLPLLEDVGEALARYVTTARGSSASRRVFVRRIAPRAGLSDPGAVSGIARAALARAGLRPAGRVGAHIFRHSLATRMIRRGASIAEIAQVLRHRSTRTTHL